ncbi:MAG TPA: metallopeptidase family protein [Acidimicrobiia bacterium]|nr:metallopeptidase family protein [Acidimicrobiia bacterium]
MKRHEFEREVDRIIEELPQWVLDEVDNLIVVVEDEPTEVQGDLLGIYEGVSLAERGDYWGALPDRIVIFYRPHLELDLPERELRAEIRKTVLHELGHHLGIDDDRLTELGWD